MRILLTGGCGYVGKALARRLFPLHEVLVFDLNRYGDSPFSAAEHRAFARIQGDVRDFACLRRVMREFDPQIVFHLAAIHYIPDCEKAPADAFAINVRGTANVLRACPPRSRLVFASSAAVYAPDTTPHAEDTSRVQPIDVYGSTKLEAENLVHELSAQRQLSSVIVRLFNVIGPGETNPHIAPAIVSQLRRGARCLRLGNVYPRRDYIHILDAARGFETIAWNMATSATSVKTVNLGTGVSHSVRDLVAIFGKVLGESLEIAEERTRVRVVERPSLTANVEKIRRLYSWAPVLTVEDAVRDLWREPDMSQALLAHS
jgi:UDP-glucose 4-epimerase